MEGTHKWAWRGFINGQWLMSLLRPWQNELGGCPTRLIGVLTGLVMALNGLGGVSTGLEGTPHAGKDPTCREGPHTVFRGKTETDFKVRHHPLPAHAQLFPQTSPTLLSLHFIWGSYKLKCIKNALDIQFSDQWLLSLVRTWENTTCWWVPAYLTI